MADGPIQFSNSVDGADMHIDTITRHGRSFSLVSVPYSLKLLIQELQAINVQMRIITDDNIDQIANMTYSNNISKLTFDKNPAQIVEQIRQELSGRKSAYGIMSTPESLVSPDESPAYNPISPGFPPGSPGFPPGSPGFPPGSPGFPPGSPGFPPGSPGFPPGSPGFPPGSPGFPPGEEMSRFDSLAANMMNSADSPAYNPHSPYISNSSPKPSDSAMSSDFDTPPPPPPDSPAGPFVVGESVHYRGDFLSSRIWVIRNIGDNFITIETETLDGLDPADTVRVVVPSDIYRPGDFTYNAQSKEDVSIPTQMDKQDRPDLASMSPPSKDTIHFAPVINISTNGTAVDTPSAQTEPSIENGTQNNENEMENAFGIQPIKVKNTISSATTTKVDEPADMFSNGLVIKKIE